jgi:hypothetical protein
MIPKMPALGLIRGVRRFSEKIMLKQKPRTAAGRQPTLRPCFMLSHQGQTPGMRL